MTGATCIAFDCHAHVFETVVPVGRPRYLPSRPAPLTAWTALLEAHGLAGGVLVQPSFLGTDNRQLLTALGRLPAGRFAGVAVVDLTVSPGELADFAEAGVRGLRWNLVEGAALPDPEAPLVRRFLERIGMAGLHLELHLEGPRLAGYLPRLQRRAWRLVIDHFGLPAAVDPAADDGLGAIADAAAKGRLWVKLSAPYRSAAGRGHARTLAAALPPDHLLWGSDWPWTRHETGRDYGRLLGAPIAAGLTAGALNRAAVHLYRLTDARRRDSHAAPTGVTAIVSLPPALTGRRAPAAEIPPPVRHAQPDDDRR